MNITEETKIKDLIPKGYELKEMSIDMDKINEDINEFPDPEYSFKLFYKKKEVKDFNWYANKYFNKVNKEYHFELVIDSNFEDIDFPFEFKIGLLKLICDDLNEDLHFAIALLNQKNNFKSLSICPPEFLKSIFK